MTESSFEIEWRKFADEIGGQIHKTEATYFNPDNTIRISGDNVIVDLVWGEQPQKGKGSYVTRQTIFKFNLKSSKKVPLKIYPRDTLSNLITLFSPNRQKTENPELDHHYIFLSDDKELVYNLSYHFKTIIQQSRFSDFVVTTEANTDSPFLTIQVNDLVIHQKALNLFYELGLWIRDKLNKAE